MMMQQYGHQSAVIINVTFGTSENKENSLIVTYIAKPRKPLKHNETRLLYVDTCWKLLMFITTFIVHIDGVWQVEKRLFGCIHNHILK
jgi:hypothetical protein